MKNLTLKLLGSLIVAVLAVTALPRAAQAQTTTSCTPDIKLQFLEEMNKIEEQYGADQDNKDGLPVAPTGKLEAEKAVYAKYQFCGLNPPPQGPAFFNAVRQCAAAPVPAQTGSTFYEEMSCCGYDPQKREFACPVRIKQNFGFGASPFPGSREYVLSCVTNAAGVFVPVALDKVHLSNSANAAPWMFAVTADVVANFNTVLPLNQATTRARSILSWNAVPRDCNYRPIWGNTVEYRIRRDQ
jgi:hypothetical protein